MYAHIKKIIMFFLLVGFAPVVNADDIDILNQESITDAQVLFIMDLSGSMNWKLDKDKVAKGDAGDPSRLQVLRGAFQDIVADSDFDEIKFGLSVFSGDAQSGKGKGLAHGITYPVSPVIGTLAQDELSKPGFTHKGISYMPAAGTMNTRQYLSLLSADTTIWSAGGSTPIVDALFEGARYFRGQPVLSGAFPADDIRSAHPATYTGSISSSTTVVTEACTIATQIVPCTCGSCGPTQKITPISTTINSSTDTGGCILNPIGIEYCEIGDPSCGNGVCGVETIPVPVECDSSISDVGECLLAHPGENWHSCIATDVSSSVINEEEQEITTITTIVKCKKDKEVQACGSNTSYSCPAIVNSCTKCPDDQIQIDIANTAVYKSPITDECSKNGIILLTDGAPTRNSTDDKVATMIGTSYANGCSSKSSSDYGRCGPELAEFLAKEDHANGSTSTGNIDGVQNVVTYTVGLALDDDSPTATYLNNIATKGQGAFINASSRSELTEAFKQAITSIVGKARSFTAPSYSVDTNTLLSHGDFVYIPVFDRAGKVWPGNLKKYKVVNGKLMDADNNLATDTTGALLDTARDYWSSDISKSAVISGGAANKIDPSSRNIKTDDGTDIIKLKDDIDNADFGLGSTSEDNDYKKLLVKYISGLDPESDTPRKHMGDIIHSKPVQLNIAGGRRVIFVGSNEGYLHAINDYDDVTDVKNGTEAFAYMPKELLPNIKKQYGTAASPEHIYGVDAPITLWIDESYHQDSTNTGANFNKIGNSILDSKEKAYIFFGLRRGGKAYYALNVTDPDEPVLVWKKSLGTGDSWSQPVVKNLIWGSNKKTKPVLVFGGGYNENADGSEAAGGNAVYIIDAITGAEVWSTKVAEANISLAPDAIANAVPSKIRVLDIDRNGSIDRLYFGDTGGNIWRADLNASNFGVSPDKNNINKATLRKFASLGGTLANGRKFFNAPSVATFKYKGRLVSSVAIGSGDRTSPLDATVNDKFFVLYDKEVIAQPTANTIQFSDLSAAAVSPTTNILDNSYKGWVMSLTNTTGEKVLSSPITYKNKVMFTTFGAISVSADSCNPGNANQAMLYIVDLHTGYTFITQEEGPGGVIPDSPQIIMSSPVDDAGEECDADNPGVCESKESICVNNCNNPVDFEDVDDGADPADVGNSPKPKSVERVYWIDNE